MAFCNTFGDETQDYAQSLRRHYETGAPAGWQERFISSYATAHPWEDWAETWAHLPPHDGRFETAAGSSLGPQPENDPSLQITYHELTSFEQKIESWLSVTYMLNNLNRGLGLPDSYP
jgi:hypothetical protein